MGLGSITPFTRMESWIIYPFAYTKGLIGPVINNLCLADPFHLGGILVGQRLVPLGEKSFSHLHKAQYLNSTQITTPAPGKAFFLLAHSRISAYLFFPHQAVVAESLHNSSIYRWQAVPIPLPSHRS